MKDITPRLLLIPFLLFGFLSHGQGSDSVYYSPTTLKNVTVIAERIDAPSEVLPFSVSNIDSTLLYQPLQNLSIQEKLTQVPGVYVQNAYNFAQDARISIRGFGANAAFGIRGIKLIVDGIPETTPDGTGQLDNLNLDQVGELKVIRGSVSSLYGNASGGAIIIKSRIPDHNFLDVQSMVGSYGFWSQAIAGGIKNDKATYQANIRYFGSEGYRDHSAFQQLNARFSSQQQLSDNLSLVFLGEYVDSPEAQDAGGLTLEETQTDFEQARERNESYDAGEAITQWKVGASLKWQWSDQGTLNTYAFFNRRLFNGKLPFEDSGIIDLERNYAGLGNSIDLETGVHSIKAGYDLLSQSDGRSRYNNLEGETGALAFDQQESFFNVGVFVMDNIVLDDWYFSGGLRYDFNQLKASDRFLANGDDSGEIQIKNLSYHLGMGRILTPELRVFLNYSTNFETPTLNQLSNRPDNTGGFEDLKAMIANNYEVGFKWRKRGLGLDLVGFITQTDNELVPYELAAFPERTFYQNSGKTLRKGIELSSSYKTTKFSAYAAYTYSNFTYQSFVQDQVALDGNQLPGIPEQQLNLNLTYQPISGLTLAVPFQYVGSLWADSENETNINDYTRLSLNLSYKKTLRSLVVEPFLGIRNLTDTQYFDNIRINAFGQRYYEPAPGRNYYFGVKIKLK